MKARHKRAKRLRQRPARAKRDWLARMMARYRDRDPADDLVFPMPDKGVLHVSSVGNFWHRSGGVFRADLPDCNKHGEPLVHFFWPDGTYWYTTRYT